MRFIQLVTLSALVLTFFSNGAFAQSSSGSTPAGHGISFHMGPLLPSNVAATEEILSGVGGRYIMPLSSNGKGLLEFGYTGSNSAGVKYSDFNLSLRGDIPFQDLFVFGVIGPNVSRMRGDGANEFTYYTGGHVGGGLLAHIADTLFLRMEMRFNFHPGTMLFFGFGFEYRFGK